jgi:hypothetical protein
MNTDPNFEYSDRQITYDHRSSVFINVGSKHKSGPTQPIGSFKVTNKYDPTKGLERGRLDNEK